MAGGAALTAWHQPYGPVWVAQEEVHHASGQIFAVPDIGAYLVRRFLDVAQHGYLCCAHDSQSFLFSAKGY